MAKQGTIALHTGDADYKVVDTPALLELNKEAFRNKYERQLSAAVFKDIDPEGLHFLYKANALSDRVRAKVMVARTRGRKHFELWLDVGLESWGRLVTAEEFKQQAAALIQQAQGKPVEVKFIPTRRSVGRAWQLNAGGRDVPDAFLRVFQDTKLTPHQLKIIAVRWGDELDRGGERDAISQPIMYFRVMLKAVKDGTLEDEHGEEG